MRTLILIVVACLVVIGLTFWIYKRWDAWFGNPQEEAYSSTGNPSRILLTFGDSIGRNRNISWQCDSLLQPSYLELNDLTRKQRRTYMARGQILESGDGKSAYYVVRLRDLDEGHAYRYRVCTAQHYSDWFNFTVYPYSDEIEFLFVGDIQDTISGIANQLLKKAIHQYPKTEFLVCGGDLIERPLDCYWTEMFQNLDSIGQSMPVFTITGNHDYWKGVICKLDPRFSLVNSYFLDSKVEDNQVFWVQYADMLLIGLDSNREFFYLFDQQKWLRKVLEASDAKWKIVIIHHPLYSISGQFNNLIQCWMFDSLIRDYQVDLVLQAHEHAYARMINEGNKTPVYTVSHCSPKNYRIEFDEMFDRFGSGSRYYQRIHTLADTLLLTAYDALSGELYDSIRIEKKSNHTLVRDCARNLPEYIEFQADSNNRKDREFAERIRRYKKRKGISQ